MSARDAAPISSSKFQTQEDMVKIAVAAAQMGGLSRVEAVTEAELLYAIDDDDIGMTWSKCLFVAFAIHSNSAVI